MSMKSIFYELLMLSAFFVSCSSGGQLSINEQYPNDWREPQIHEKQAISRVLLQNQVADCGWYYVKTYIDGGDEYLVACTEDNQTWNYYKIWLSTREVTSVEDTTIAAPELERTVIP